MTLAVTQHVVVTTTGSGSGGRVIPGAAASALGVPLCRKPGVMALRREPGWRAACVSGKLSLLQAQKPEARTRAGGRWRGPPCALDIRVPHLALHVSVPERPADATDTNGVSGGAGRSVDSATWVQHAPSPSESAPMRTQSSPDYSSTPGRDLALPVSRSGGCRS